MLDVLASLITAQSIRQAMIKKYEEGTMDWRNRKDKSIDDIAKEMENRRSFCLELSISGTNTYLSVHDIDLILSAMKTNQMENAHD